MGTTPVPPKVFAAIAETLGMRRRGAGNVFSQLQDTDALVLAGRVYFLVKDNHKVSIACENIAKEHGVDVSTVRRAWNKYKPLFESEGPRSDRK